MPFDPRGNILDTHIPRPAAADQKCFKGAGGYIIKSVASSLSHDSKNGVGVPSKCCGHFVMEDIKRLKAVNIAISETRSPVAPLHSCSREVDHQSLLATSRVFS